MKKVLALMRAMVLVLSLAACGNSEKDLKEEQEAVNKAIEGGWSNKEYINESYYEGDLLYVYVFLNGKYSFDNIQVKTKETWHSEEGTYTVNAQKKKLSVPLMKKFWAVRWKEPSLMSIKTET